MQAAAALAELQGVRLWPPAGVQRSGILSFTLDGVHPHDLAQVASERGVAIRAGHHCAQPLMRSLGLVATARASFGVYNDPGDVNALVDAVDSARALLG
jgi:cysteine desulfurase/selenocysteine lyase